MIKLRFDSVFLKSFSVQEKYPLTLSKNSGGEKKEEFGYPAQLLMYARNVD